MPPVGIGAPERPGDESACTRSCASASCVVTDHAAIPRCCFFLHGLAGKGRPCRQGPSLLTLVCLVVARQVRAFPLLLSLDGTTSAKPSLAPGADGGMESPTDIPSTARSNTGHGSVTKVGSMASPTGPRLGGEGRDGTSQSPWMVANAGTRPGPTESVDGRIRRFRSRVVKEGDKSRAYCY